MQWNKDFLVSIIQEISQAGKLSPLSALILYALLYSLTVNANSDQSQLNPIFL